MNSKKITEEFLKTIGFKTEEDGYLVLVLNQGKDRFKSEVWIEKEKFAFGTHLSRGFDYVKESRILDNTNGLNASTKEHWLEVKKKIVDAGYEVELKNE